jgi:hypothetical protein
MGPSQDIASLESGRRDFPGVEGGKFGVWAYLCGTFGSLLQIKLGEALSMLDLELLIKQYMTTLSPIIIG